MLKKKCIADLDGEQALIEPQINSRQENPTTTSTTTQAVTTSNAKNCRSLIQKRAHTLDDFMEGNVVCQVSARE